MSEAAVWSADVRAFGSTPTTGAEAGAAPVEPRRDRDDGERKSAWCVRMRYLLTEHIEGCGNPVATIESMYVKDNTARRLRSKNTLMYIRSQIITAVFPTCRIQVTAVYQAKLWRVRWDCGRRTLARYLSGHAFGRILGSRVLQLALLGDEEWTRTHGRPCRTCRRRLVAWS